MDDGPVYIEGTPQEDRAAACGVLKHHVAVCQMEEVVEKATFQRREESRLILLKPKLLSAAGCLPGLYRKSAVPRNFCVSHDHRTENLFGGIRTTAIDYFTARRIPWHSLAHLRCSQSCCVNCLFPLMYEPASLRRLFRELGYPVAEVLPFELDSLAELQQAGWRLHLSGASKPQDELTGFLAFEWIGEKNYLRELRAGKVASDTGRTRGHYFTSADAAIRFRRDDGRTQIVLVEWKYTEKYQIGRCLRYSASNTDRLDRIYRSALEATDCQIRLGGLPPEVLFYDPFDQMMRQQLLASAMEREREMGAEIVSYLHIAPRANVELLDRITSPALASCGHDIDQVWLSLVGKERFHSIHLEELLPLLTAASPNPGWSDYLRLRFRGMN